MDRLRALEILAFLADGVDPYSGEQYPYESPYQHPETVRALYTAMGALGARQTSARKALPQKAGQPWSAGEDQALRREVAEGRTLRSIAEEHGRTPGAIGARLVRLGVFATPQEAQAALSGASPSDPALPHADADVHAPHENGASATPS